MDTQRLDKWLWVARFYKTRALAQKAIQNQQILVDGQKSTASRQIKVGLKVTIKKDGFVRNYIIQGLAPQRRPYQEAKLLYQETDESVEQNKKVAEQKALQRLVSKPTPLQRPDKKSRRLLRDIRRKQD